MNNQLPQSYLDNEARATAQAESALTWYEAEMFAAGEAGDDDASCAWSWLGMVPADVLLDLCERHGAEWMRANVPGDWEARRIWGHDWLERPVCELRQSPAWRREAMPASVELEEPTFLDDEVPSADLPTFIDTANIRSLYGWQPGETLEEAIARHQGRQRSSS